jgi:hypothetical protein
MSIAGASLGVGIILGLKCGDDVGVQLRIETLSLPGMTSAHCAKLFRVFSLISR